MRTTEHEGMQNDGRGVAALLLITQAGLALLAALGLHTYITLTKATALLALPQLIAFGGPVLLAVLAIGIARGSRAAALAVYAYEGLTLAGTAFSILSEGSNALVLTAGLTGLALPGAIMYFVARPTNVRRSLTTALLLATAFIHLTLVPEHLAEDPTLGRLFLLDGVGFLVMAGLSMRPSQWWRAPAAALLVATILAYLVVVLRGQESVDDLGVATKFIELLALGLVMWTERISWRWTLAAATLVGSVVFSGGLAWAATLRPGSETGHTHSHALESKTLIAEAAPTEAQREAAAQLVEDTRSGIARFTDVNVALADGYRPSTPAAAPTVHYANPKYLHSGIVDPSHPQELVYANTANGPMLLGAMYMTTSAKQAPPDIGGSLTEWHTHNTLCFWLPNFIIDGIQSPFGTCPVGSINGPTPAMLHVWTVANPGGPFADLTPSFVARVTGAAAASTAVGTGPFKQAE